MNQFDENMEFDIKALFFHIVRQWKWILVAAVVLAVLLGGWKGYSAYSEAQDVAAKNEEAMQTQQDPEQIAYYEERIALTQKKIDTLEEYMHDSVIMNLDSRNVYTAKAIYYIDTQYKILPENTYQETNKNYTLAWFYRRYVSEYNVFESLSDTTGIPVKYLKEMVEISIPTDFTVSVYVNHSNAEEATQILDMLQEILERTYPVLNDTVGAHILTKIEDGCGAYVDEDIKSLQQEKTEELLTLKNEKMEYSEELAKLQEVTTLDAPNVTKEFVQWVIIGGVLGVVLVVAYVLVMAFFGNRVYAGSQLHCAYHITTLGEVICSKNALPPVARILNRLEGCLTENSDENLQYIAENLKHYCADAKNVLICSDANTEVSTQLAEMLNVYLAGVQLQPAGNLLKEAGALQQLAACDAVVLIAQRETSKTAAIEKMMKQIRAYNKEIIGLIVTY